MTPTREQAVAGIAGSLRGLPIYEEPEKTYLSENAAPATLNTSVTNPPQNQGFGSGGWQGWKTFAQSQAETAMQTAQQQQRTVDFNNPSTYTGKTAEEVLAILKSLPDDAEFPHELITTIKLPMLTQADMNKLGEEESHRLGIETGPDMRALKPVMDEVNRRFANKVASFRYPLNTGINIGQTIDDVVGSAMAMWNARQSQNRVDTIGGDKYWHAYGNAAASMSPIGAWVAKQVSDFVERLNSRTDQPAIIQNDQTANEYARYMAQRFPGLTPEQIAVLLKPPGAKW